MSAPDPRNLPIKDRAAPFSRKHKRYWFVVTGGMLIIGAVNVLIGYLLWPPSGLDPQTEPELIIFKPAPPIDGGPSDVAPAPPVDAAATPPG